MFPLTVTTDHKQAAVSILVGLVFLWLVSKATLDRRVPKQLIYLLLLAGIFYAANYVGIGGFGMIANLLALPAIFLATLYTIPDGYHWLPGFSRRKSDEVGIEKSNLKKARRQNMAWALLLTAFFIYLGSMQEVTHVEPLPPAEIQVEFE